MAAGKKKQDETIDLAETRKRINEVDEQIQSLINERARFAQQVGVAKGDLGAAVGLLFAGAHFNGAILLGLLLYGVGCLLFLPAGASMEFEAFLAAYFVMTCGLSFLETTANPYILSMGPSLLRSQPGSS